MIITSISSFFVLVTFYNLTPRAPLAVCTYIHTYIHLSETKIPQSTLHQDLLTLDILWLRVTYVVRFLC